MKPIKPKQVKRVPTRTEILKAIEEIRQVATGQWQVANDDTEGLDWIAKRIDALNLD